MFLILPVRIGGRRIGLVGYITPSTVDISNPEQLIFIDEIQALNEVFEENCNFSRDCSSSWYRIVRKLLYSICIKILII